MRQTLPSRQALSLMLLSLVVLFSSSSLAFAGDGERTVSVEDIGEGKAPRIDAMPDDEIWQLAEPTWGFTQQEPDEGDPSTYKTTFRVAHDRANLYILARMDDPEPDKIVNSLTRRDRDSESDWFGLLIDSYHDHTTGRFFMVNAAGVQRDGTVSTDNEMDGSWDGVWESAVNIVEDGWILELRIPFSALRFSSSDEEAVWGLNALRYISRKKELSWWAREFRSDSRLVSRSGHLTGINTSQAPSRASATPYAATSGLVDTTSGEAEYSTDLTGDVGVDVQYGISSDVTLDLSINPDFGQVEVDQEVLNLSAFETILQEKRPFFLEGADIFKTAGTLGDGDLNTQHFYSRRLGGEETPIIAAAKITGRSDNGLSVGILEAVTGDLTPTEDEDADEEVPPTATNTIARVRQEVGAASYFGGIVTAQNKFDGQADAYAVAVDGNYRTDSGYSIQGIVTGSAVEAETDEVAANDEPSVLTGIEANVIGMKESGEKFVAAGGYRLVTADFDINTLGYNQKTNEQMAWFWGQLRKLDGFGPFRLGRLNINAWAGGLLDQAEPAYAGGNFNGNIQLQNFWNAYAGVGYGLPGYDQYESYVEGRLFRHSWDANTFAGISSDSRKSLVASLHGNLSTDGFGGQSLYLGPSLTLKIGTRTELSLGGSYQRTVGAMANAYPDDASEELIIFGGRSVDKVDSWARGTFTFSEKLSLQFFSQLLVARWAYQDFMQLLPDGGLEAYTPDATLGSPDSSWQYFNANAILRWEYLPGSTLYAVWTQSRELDSDYYDGPLLAEAGSALGRGSVNALMLKVSYRWGT